MTNLIIQVSKYLIIILMALYTFQSYTVFQKRDEESRHYLFLRQNMLMFFMHFVAFMVLYLELSETTILLFYAAQVAYLAIVLFLFSHLYPRASRLLINNMCMLISIGFIMITRLSYEQSVKQFKIAAASSLVALLIPVIIRKLRFITRMYWIYVLLGIGMLALVAIAARTTYGAKLSFTVGGITVQPSEFVKIIYVFAIAGLLAHARDFKRIVVATALAALHVLILVASKDLGSALIYFVTYLIMLFVSTRNPFLVLAGIFGGSAAAVGAYFLFSHVRVRVQIWRDPFADYQGTGYQICQSLFAISAGSWFGTGLCLGSPNAIPVVEQDFMFAAISEELGSIFGICLLLVCMSCFIMFVNISMQLTNRYYRLVAVGLGTTYATQVFLTVGGCIKLIPMTGVTLPLVSYGGSSMLGTQIMFAIVQGLYMLRRDEAVKTEEKRQQQEQQFFEQQYQQGGFYGGGPYPQDQYYNGGQPYDSSYYNGTQDPYYPGGQPYSQDPYNPGYNGQPGAFGQMNYDDSQSYPGGYYAPGQADYPGAQGGQEKPAKKRLFVNRKKLKNSEREPSYQEQSYDESQHGGYGYEGPRYEYYREEEDQYWENPYRD